MWLVGEAMQWSPVGEGERGREPQLGWQVPGRSGDTEGVPFVVNFIQKKHTG